MVSVFHVGTPQESQNILCKLHGCRKCVYTKRMPAIAALRESFEGDVAYPAKTVENKERHMRELTQLIAWKDEENAANA